MTLIDTKPFYCEQCGEPFKPRSGTGGSAQRFCSTAHRLRFHRERLREQRTSRNAGQSSVPYVPEQATAYEQAERLMARLTPEERRRLFESSLDDAPITAIEDVPKLPLEPVAPTVPGDERQGFAEFYRVYPLHIARGAAERAYRRIIKNGEATEADLLAGAMRYAAAQDGKDPRYIKHPTTWLNGKCWLDEPAPAGARPRSYLDSIRDGLAVHLDEEGA
jgi:hypothetical protein